MNVFSRYKQRNKERLVYLESKLRQDRYGSCIFKLKCRQTEERSERQAKHKEDTADVFKY